MPVSDKPSAILRQATPTPSLKGKQSGPGQYGPAPEQQSLLLAPAEQLQSPPLRAKPVHRLWLCIYLPALALEAVSSASEAFAVFEDKQGIRKILRVNAKAAALGIGPGLSVNAALALLPTLGFAERNLQGEAQVLHELAGWAEKFTSFVCIEAPSVLLLEIAGSLQLFGGLKSLRQRIALELERQGFSAAMAIAPTPLAASWMARAGRKVCIRDPQSLAGKLAPLPLSCLDWPDSVCTSLRGMGVSSVGDCLRSYDLEELANYFVAYRQLIDHWQSVMPGVMHVVKYEELVTTPKPVIEGLLSACGLSWEDACLKFYESTFASTTASAVQVRRNIFQSSIGKWRNYEQQLKPVSDILGEFL